MVEYQLYCGFISSGDRYLGGSATDCREILHDVPEYFRPFWGRYP